MRYFVLLLMFLACCQSMDHKHFGMSKQEWQKLNEQQQANLSKKYWLIKKKHLLTLKKSYSTPYKKINVKLVKGSALMWPEKKKLAFMPVALELSAGSCKELELFSTGKLSSTKAEVCYDGKHLSLDPSHWQEKFANGGLIIARHHLWKQGMVYQNLNSKGYAALTNTSVFVRAG